MGTIHLENITKTYGRGKDCCKAVDGVNLRIQHGEFFFLLGPSGCGKTTLLRVLAGLIHPTAGRVLFGERDVTDVPVHLRDSAMVFQNYALWPHMNVQTNVEFGPRMQHVSQKERQRRGHEALERVNMANLTSRRPRQLSGGQQQRVAVARALAASPACLLMDEPLSNLDAQLRLSMRQQLREIVKASQTTAVYVTHDQKEALAMADRIAVMRDGKIMQVDTPVQIYEQPTSRFVAEFVGEANFISGIFKDRGSQNPIVKTAAGELETLHAESFTADQPQLCCVRPEKVTLTPETGEVLPGTLRGRVVNVTYQGETLQYHIELTTGEKWKVLALGNAAQREIGEAVYLKIPPEAVRILNDPPS